jgi:hypothetical protein
MALGNCRIVCNKVPSGVRRLEGPCRSWERQGPCPEQAPGNSRGDGPRRGDKSAGRVPSRPARSGHTGASWYSGRAQPPRRRIAARRGRHAGWNQRRLLPMVQRQSAATASSSTDPIDPYVAARPAQLTSIDLPAARSHRGGQGKRTVRLLRVSWRAVVRLLEYPGGSRERFFELCHAFCPHLGGADECPVGGAEGGHDFEPGYQVRMPSFQSFPAVPG